MFLFRIARACCCSLAPRRSAPPPTKTSGGTKPHPAAESRNARQNAWRAFLWRKAGGSKAEYNGTRYNYYEYMIERCRAFGWELKSFDNHSKLLLMRTRENWYTVETSSNLNENPKMEQFCWENDQTLFEWYRELFVQLLGAKSGEERK